MQALRIVFAGTPAFGLASLSTVAASEHEIVAIYTQPDRPSGRGRKIHASAIKQFAIEKNIAIYQPLNFKNHVDLAKLKELKPDVMLVIAYGLILPKEVLDIPTFGCVNVHASILPRWRGAAPIQHAILNGDKETGVSIMQMDKGMDTGGVYKTATVAISKTTTASSLHDSLAVAAIAPLMTTLQNIANMKAVPQDNKFAKTAPKIKKEHAKINWHESAEIIERKIRAYNPWPGAWSVIDNKNVKIFEAYYTKELVAQKAGMIINISKKVLR